MSQTLYYGRYKKPDKVKIIQIVKSYTSGGLKMIDIDNLISSLKITWFRRLLNTDNKPWAKLLVSSINGFSKIFDMGPLLKLLINKAKNPFWRTALESYVTFFSINKSNDPDDLLSAPIWYNPMISLNL